MVKGEVHDFCKTLWFVDLVRGTESNGEGPMFVRYTVQEIFAIEIDHRAGAAYMTRPGYISTHPRDFIELYPA